MGDSIVTESGSNIGIGTGAPNSKLHVVGALEIGATAGSGINPTIINPNTLANFAQVRFYPASGTNVNTSFAVVPKGTGQPNNKAQFSILGTDSVADPANNEFATFRARGTDFVLATGKTGTGQNRPLMLASGFVTDNVTNNGQLYLATNGNVGLGTTSPASRLDIDGATSFRGMAAPAVAPAGQGRIFFDSGTNKFRVSQNNGAYVDLVGGGGLTLPFSASQSSASTLFSVTNTGTGSAGNFAINNSGSGANALTVTSNTNFAALKVTNTGGGHAADFRNEDASSGLPVLFLQNVGAGKGIEVQHNGLTGQGATIILGNSNNPNNALEVSTNGTGGGAVISAGNTATTLTVNGGLRSLVLQGGRFVMQYANFTSGTTLPNSTLVANILDNGGGTAATTTLPDPNNVEAGTIIYISSFDQQGVTVTYSTGAGNTTTNVTSSEIRYFMRVGTGEACCPLRWKPEH